MSQIEEALAEVEARADLAEEELTALRRDLRDYVAWLKSPERGTVIFRSEVVGHLSEILAP